MSEPTPTLPIAFERDRPQEVWIIQPPRQRLWLHILLLVATFLTTMVVGSRMQSHYLHNQPVLSADEDLFWPFLTWVGHPSELLPGVPFSLTLMFILLAHEMGHYLYARHYRVYATLPFFVPFISLIGTLGAFIRIKSQIPSRAALFDIGIAGPIAGFIPSCAAVLAGLSLSHPLPSSSGPPDNELGFPLIFHLGARILHISAPLSSLSLHPIAVAGWVGMFATSLNLLPGGQLDGGHILFSVLPKLHRWISFLTVLALIPLARYCWMGWLLWAVVLWLTSHHPPVPTYPGISGSRRLVAMFGVAMLVLALTPAPFSEASGRDVWRQAGLPTVQRLGQRARDFLHRK
jgi:membrane-associated protease RseP (regulator of RpoE activity)